MWNCCEFKRCQMEEGEGEGKEKCQVLKSHSISNWRGKGRGKKSGQRMNEKNCKYSGTPQKQTRF